MELIDIGWRARFPDRPDLSWSSVAREATDRARRDLPWVFSDGLIDRELLERMAGPALVALQQGVGSIIGHGRNVDGQDLMVLSDALDAAQRRQLLINGGGLLLDGAHTWSPALNSVCGRLAVATERPVIARALLGSEPTRIDGNLFEFNTIVPVASPVIVHPDGAAPFDVPVGTAVRVEGMPRILAHAGSLTLLLSEVRLTDSDYLKVLLDRGTAHPLLRLDAPARVDRPAEVYGMEDSVDFGQLICEQIDLLHEGAPDDLIGWWWLLGQPLGSVDLPEGDTIWVRGRFPGGIGVIPAEGGTIVRAGGHTFTVAEEEEQVLRDLVAGRRLVLRSGSPSYEAVALLASIGLVDAGPAEHRPGREQHEHSSGDETLDLDLDFEVDGLALRIHLAPEIDQDLRDQLARVTAGYRRPQIPPAAVLDVSFDDGLTLLCAEFPPGPPPPLVDPVHVTRTEDALLHTTSWIDQMSLAYGHPGRIRIHAAAFVDDERTWVVSGAAGAGKATLTLEATARGAAFVADEHVTIDDDGARVTIMGRGDGMRLRPGELGWLADSEPDLLWDGQRHVVDPSTLDALGVVRTTESVRPTDLLLLVESIPTEVTQGWATATLAQFVKNLSAVGPSALLHVARLVAECRFHVRPVRSLSATTDLAASASLPSTTPPIWLSRGDDDGPFRISDGVDTMLVGAEILIWVPTAPVAIVHLNGEGATWWTSLTTAGLGPMAPPDEALVDQLVSAGALRTATTA